MEWKNQLTKTPYLVLFIVLLTVGVGTASALITITLSGNVIVTGDLDVDGSITGNTITNLENQISNIQNALCSTETCNGLDDDCDGSIDEGGICPCDPFNPDAVCGEDSHCSPTQSGTPVCSGPTGSGVIGNACSSSDECLPELACINPGDGLQCSQWCRVGGSDCYSGSCVSTSVFIGAQEWGVCVG
jgi:hypothetical protein